MNNPKTEAQRRWRARAKQKKLDADAARPEVFQTPFHEFEDLALSDADLCLALAGIQIPVLEDDRGPHAFVINDATEDVEDPFSNTPANSLGRAEVILGCLISAAAEMSGYINQYKRMEIEARIKEIEEADLSDPQKRKAALAEIVRLNKMLDRLNKQVRWTFAQWRVTD